MFSTLSKFLPSFGRANTHRNQSRRDNLSYGRNRRALEEPKSASETLKVDDKSGRMNLKGTRIGSSTLKRQHNEYIVDDDISKGREHHKIPALSYIRNDYAPDDFHYVNQYIHCEPIDINTSISQMYSCNCEQDCADGSCLCSSSHKHGRCYDSKGRLNSEYNFTMPEAIYECNISCKCNGKLCRNRVIQLGTKGRFALFRTKSRGWGVKTLTDLKCGSFIGVYSGELISTKDSTMRADDTYLFNLSNSNVSNSCQEEISDSADNDANQDDENNDKIEVGQDAQPESKVDKQASIKSYVCDAKRYGNFTRFINHSCEPNVIGIKSYTTHQDTRFPYIAFFTNCYLPANSELTLNYGDNYWLIKCKRDAVHCLCKKESCRFSKKTFAITYKQYREKRGP